jgi:hypothetical protein
MKSSISQRRIGRKMLRVERHITADRFSARYSVDGDSIDALNFRDTLDSDGCREFLADQHEMNGSDQKRRIADIAEAIGAPDEAQGSCPRCGRSHLLPPGLICFSCSSDAARLYRRTYARA